MDKLLFSTGMLPFALSAEQKARVWTERIIEQGEREASCPFPEGFQATMQAFVGDGIVISRAYASSIQLTRGKHHIARDGNDSITLIIGDGPQPIGGSQRDNEVTLRQGDALILSQAEPNMTHALSGGNVMALTLSRSIFARFGYDPTRFAGRMIGGHETRLRLLHAYLQHLFDLPDPVDARLLSLASVQIAELTNLVISGADERQGSRDIDDPAGAALKSAASVRATLILQAISNNSSRPDLDVDAIGRLLGMSGRTVQQSLKDEGTTFSDELRRVRMAHAESLLADRRLDHLSIVQIAYACGFADVSTFYRAFRMRGGPAPSEIRSRR